jgi:hypothetical protein
VNAATRQHTPGPYVRDGLFILTQRIENTTGIGELVAKLPEFESRKFVGESEADYKARFRRFCATGDLLASAPDLLSALESIAALEPSIMSKHAEEGFRYHTDEDAYRIHLAGLINQARAIARAAIARATEGGAL